MAATSPGPNNNNSSERDACLKVGLQLLVSRRKASNGNACCGKKRKKALEEEGVSNEAARRIGAAALVADRIHRETLVLINLYARDAEEQKRVIRRRSMRIQ